jgi:pimeloyl-ACP methyl ester carboxylesterase
VIGHKQYVAQGGDVGSEITVLLAYNYPRSVKAIHLNLLPWGYIPPEQQTPEEKMWSTTGDAYMAAEFDYLRLQVNRPMMPQSPSDSPMMAADRGSFTLVRPQRGLDKTVPKGSSRTSPSSEHTGVEGSCSIGPFATSSGLRCAGQIDVLTSVALFPRSTRWVVRL